MSNRRILILSTAVPFGIARFPAAAARHGWQTEAFTPPWSHLHHSSYLAVRHPVPEDKAAWAEAMARLVEQGDWAHIFYGDDPTMRIGIASGNPTLLGALPVNTERFPAEAVCNKARFAAWMEEHDFPTPKSIVTAEVERVVEWWRELGDSRIIVKPAEGQAGSGIFSPRNQGDLRAQWPGHECVVQEYLTGRPLVVEWVARRGRLLAVALYWKNGMQREFGISVERRYLDGARIEELATRFCSESGFHGIGGADLFETEDGRILFIETHMRPTGGIGFRRASGVDLIAALDAKESEPVTRSRDGGRVILFPEIAVGRMESGGPLALAATLLRPLCWREMAWNDRGLLRRQWWEVRRLMAKWRRG